MEKRPVSVDAFTGLFVQPGAVKKISNDEGIRHRAARY
jgi:hypothetical protein